MKKGFFTRSRTAKRAVAVAMLCAWLPSGAWGAVQVSIPPALVPLNQVVVPEPPNLFQFVKNKPAAIRLGKALFWDMQVGSDGIQACGTCHFQAGVDSLDVRKKNQINPGTNAGDTIFGNGTVAGHLTDYPLFRPNYTLDLLNDFPLHQRATPVDSQASLILRDTNDVVGSQGVRFNKFMGVNPDLNSDVDLMETIPDPIFNLNGANVRRVEPRNTPSMINAIFNFQNFWDGRASFIFNGNNPFGQADLNSGVWFNELVAGNPTLVKRKIEIQFASLASLATGPPLSDFEMSAQGRTLPELGRKMIPRAPLKKQLVHPGDSVLGTLSNAVRQPDGTITGAKGLRTTYRAMIEAAFQDHLWNATAPVTELKGTVNGVPNTPTTFTQMEANFDLFFGLALQSYMGTLVSDQSKFDRFLGGEIDLFTDQEKTGFNIFFGSNCVICHGFSEMTNASNTSIAFLTFEDNAILDFMPSAAGVQGMYDNGYFNTGVRPTAEDLARGGTAPFLNPLDIDLLTGLQKPFPLSFVQLTELQAQSKLPFPTVLLRTFVPPTFPVNDRGSFKAPGLRNVALTSPYFHNGSVKSLEEVVEFYARAGNFQLANIADLDPNMVEFPVLKSPENRAALVAFLKTLTDPRVASDSAPFDHPEIFLPNGSLDTDGSIDAPLIRLAAHDADGVEAPPLTFTLNQVVTPTSQISQTIGGTVEAGATLTVTVGATTAPAVITGTTWSFNATGLVPGANTITVTAVDTANVVTTLTATIFVDTAAPTLTLNPVASPTRAVSQTVSGSVDAGVTPVVTVAFPTTASPAVITGGTNWASHIDNFREGPNTVTVSATDATLNAAAPQTATIILDTIAPAVVLNPVTATTTLTTQTISGLVEAGATVGVSINGAAAAPATVTGTNWSYTIPLLNAGVNTVTVTATDAAQNTALAPTATISVITNAAPVAVDDAFTTTINVARTFNVIANDTDVDGIAANSVVITTNPLNGTVAAITTGVNAGSVTYTPNPGFVGTNTFTYNVKDNAGAVSNDATVTVTVTGAAATTEIVNILQAQFRSGKNEWRVNGTTVNSPAGSVITIRVGNGLTGPVVGTATVGVGGAWSVQVTNPAVVPDATRTISVSSSGGGSRLAFPVAVRN